MLKAREIVENCFDKVKWNQKQQYAKRMRGAKVEVWDKVLVKFLANKEGKVIERKPVESTESKTEGITVDHSYHPEGTKERAEIRGEAYITEDTTQTEIETETDEKLDDI